MPRKSDRMAGEYSDEELMKRALDEARAAADAGEAPIGAVVVDVSGKILAAAGNAPIGTHDPTAHAEIRALRATAEKIGNYRLNDTTLFVTLEPCAMCAGAISHARVKRLVIAASDPKGGAVWHGPKFFEQTTCHWRPEVEQGPFADEAGQMLKEFFKARR
ncbi:MAG: nucleoside deaminase [Marinicaulis sp.]|nr:nucleoside deaminase [Marinicaulis sp.]